MRFVTASAAITQMRGNRKTHTAECMSLTLQGHWMPSTADIRLATKEAQQSLKFINLESHPCDSRIRIVDDEIMQTLHSRMGTGGGNVPLIIEVRDESDSVGCAEQTHIHDR